MSVLDRLHGMSLLIWAPVVGNLLLAAWAGVYAAGRRPGLPPAFWAVMLAVLALLSLQALPGLLLLTGGVRPRAALHLLYGGLIAAAGVAQYGLRPRGFLRARLAAGPAFAESRIMALLCLTEAALMMRAWMTGAFGR